MEDNKDLLKIDDNVSLETSMEELEQRLLTETNVDKLNDVITMFNYNLKLKDLVRTGKLNDLQDKITAQMTTRIDKNANEFSNKDLLDYFKVLQDTINKSDNTLDNVDTPAIQINQQINVGTEELSRESRERVKNFISGFLENAGYSADDLNTLNIIEEDK